MLGDKVVLATLYGGLRNQRSHFTYRTLSYVRSIPQIPTTESMETQAFNGWGDGEVGPVAVLPHPPHPRSFNIHIILPTTHYLWANQDPFLMRTVVCNYDPVSYTHLTLPTNREV